MTPLGAVVIRRAGETAQRRDGSLVLRRMSNRKAKRTLDLRLDINMYGGQPHLNRYRASGA